MKAGKKRKRFRFMAVIFGVMCVSALNSVLAQAATKTTECVGVVALYDASGEAEEAGTAIIVGTDSTFGALTIPFSGDMEEANAVLMTGTGNQYEVSYAGEDTFGGRSLLLWEVETSEEGYENISSDTAFLKLADPHQNDMALAVFLDVDTQEIETTLMTLLECDGNGILTADQYPSGALYPAALVNKDGKLIGICLEENVIWAVRNGAEFYDHATQAEAADTKAPPLPEREEKQSSEASEQQETDTVARQKETSADGDLSSDAVAVGVVTVVVIIATAVIFIVAAAAVIFILVGRKKKQQTASHQAKAVTPSSGEETESVPNTMPVQFPVSAPIPDLNGLDASANLPKLWLVAKGGCMNGRVYPIEKSEISIGRDASSVIHYPAGTVGVSRVHAKIYWQNGQLMLMDCNSTSGTFLHRQGKLTAMVPVEIRSGDMFYIGEKLNSFEIRE